MKYYQQELYKKGVALFKSGASKVVIANSDEELLEVSDLGTFKQQYKLQVLYGATVTDVYVR